jgi:hypothetical protein
MADRLRHVRSRLLLALAGAAIGQGMSVRSAIASEVSSYVALEWVAPDVCPDALAVGKELDRLLEGMSVSGAPFLRARAEVRQDPSGSWAVELRTTGSQGPGLRVVTAESCRALADATALILALAVDPGRVAANRPTETTSPQISAPTARDDGSPRSPPPTGTGMGPPPTPTPPIAAAPKSTERPRTVARPAPKLPIMRWEASASGVLDFGTLPASAPGVAARVAFRPSMILPLRLELGATLFFDEERTLPAAQSGRFSLWAFDAGACAETPWVFIEVGACANVEAAWAQAVGLYETQSSRGDAAWMVLRARATVAYRWSSAWAIRADGGVGYNMSRPEFVSLGASDGFIHQPAPVTGRGTLGLEIRF